MNAHLRAAWNRRIAYSSDLIARGLVISEYPESFAKKVADDSVTAEDFIRYLDDGHGVGIWWGVMGVFGDLEDFEAYAYGAGDPDVKLRGMIEEGRVGEDYIAGEISVVLIAKRPMRGKAQWDPEVHNPPDALMGNSYVDPGERLEVIEVRYDAGWGWRSLSTHIVTTAIAAGGPIAYRGLSLGMGEPPSDSEVLARLKGISPSDLDMAWENDWPIYGQHWSTNIDKAIDFALARASNVPQWDHNRKDSVRWGVVLEARLRENAADAWGAEHYNEQEVRPKRSQVLTLMAHIHRLGSLTEDTTRGRREHREQETYVRSFLIPPETWRLGSLA